MDHVSQQCLYSIVRSRPGILEHGAAGSDCIFGQAPGMLKVP